MKIALVVTDNFSMWNFRRGLLRSCAKAGHDTYALTPSGDYDDRIRQLGVTLIPIKVDRFINPAQDLAFIFQLYRLFRRHRFDIVHNVSIKPNIYGAIAAHLAGIPTIVGSMTGRGTLFMDETAPYIKALRKACIPLYRFALSLTDRVWFLTKDDGALFVSSGIVAPDKVIVICGSGVDLADLAARPRNPAQKIKELQIEDSWPVVTMAARTLWSKGVEEFIECSKIVRRSFPRVKFLLAGSSEKGNPEAIPESYLQQHRSSAFQWLGWRTDVPEIFAVSHVALCLSRQYEAIPNSLLEAMAMEKPVIATDIPGCREVVDQDKNGYLVAPRSAVAAAEAVMRLLGNPEMQIRFGRWSREKVREFDQLNVSRRILRDLYRLSDGTL